MLGTPEVGACLLHKDDMQVAIADGWKPKSGSGFVCLSVCNSLLDVELPSDGLYVIAVCTHYGA